MHPFSLPVAIGLNSPGSEDNPTQIECIGHICNPRLKKVTESLELTIEQDAYGAFLCDALVCELLPKVRMSDILSSQSKLV